MSDKNPNLVPFCVMCGAKPPEYPHIKLGDKCPNPNCFAEIFQQVNLNASPFNNKK